MLGNDSQFLVDRFGCHGDMDFLRFELGEDGRHIREEEDMTAFTGSISLPILVLVE